MATKGGVKSVQRPKKRRSRRQNALKPVGQQRPVVATSDHIVRYERGKIAVRNARTTRTGNVVAGSLVSTAKARRLGVMHRRRGRRLMLAGAGTFVGGVGLATGAAVLGHPIVAKTVAFAGGYTAGTMLGYGLIQSHTGKQILRQYGTPGSVRRGPPRLTTAQRQRAARKRRRVRGKFA